MSFLRTALASALLLIAADANAQGFDPGALFSPNRGLFAPDYITPSERNPGYMTGGPQRVSARGGRMVFAAATVDARCQQDGSPLIQVIAPPRRGRVAIDLGRFVATGIDAGFNYCVGRQVRGTRVFYLGQPPRGGDRFVIRVAYPNRWLTFDHEIAVPGR